MNSGVNLVILQLPRQFWYQNKASGAGHVRIEPVPIHLSGRIRTYAKTVERVRAFH
jgi:hypothetical protein